MPYSLGRSALIVKTCSHPSQRSGAAPWVGPWRDGTKKREYLAGNLAASKVQLSAQDRAEIEQVAFQGVAAGTRYPEGFMRLLNGQALVPDQRPQRSLPAATHTQSCQTRPTTESTEDEKAAEPERKRLQTLRPSSFFSLRPFHPPRTPW